VIARQGIPRRAVFVDTGAFFALTFSGDTHHREGVDIYDRLVAERRDLVTSNFVLAETHALIVNRLNRTVALRVLDDIEGGSTRVIRVTTADETVARAILHSHRDKDYSLTDATSFAVMQRLGMTAAFAFDRHFVQYGFSVLGRTIG
jgi:hypothetical protein